ncbi:esterase-like activity of phytase family protein [Roseibium litorale]|uniref:Esterase-like activity of phytase family protein n=1 Tax=Roseibium litorale TaxID=2803841 RepID=A0ABR9CQY2_9HYPH|nr:esterase-like activity of phytase family protein [Roseibium litorale]MBD8893069.1 esterase-like activity of phytase family protein [Roseibium litorale]
MLNRLLVSASFAFLLSAPALALETGTRFDTPCPLSDCSASISLSFLGEVTLPTGTMIDGVEFGGISGLDYDFPSRRFIAISDDRSQKAPARFYDLDIQVDAKGLHSVNVSQTTTLLDTNGKPFAEKTVDPEAIRFSQDGILWTSEGDAKAGLPPFLRVTGDDGQFVREFVLPEGFAPSADKTSGIRNNNAFESLAVMKDGDIIVGLEAALYQDGPASTLTNGSLARLIRFDATSGLAKAQYVYPVSPIPQAPVKADGWNDNGMPEILALDNHRLLTLERGYAQDIGNTIRLFMIDLDGATDVSKIGSLSTTEERIVPVRKTQILDLGAIGLTPDNVEAMTFAKGQDGTDVLILASDNNFNAEQTTQFLAFEVLKRPR